MSWMKHQSWVQPFLISSGRCCRHHHRVKAVMRPSLVAVRSRSSFLYFFPQVHSQGGDGISGHDHHGAPHELRWGSPFGHKPPPTPLQMSICCLHGLRDGLHTAAAVQTQRKAPLTPRKQKNSNLGASVSRIGGLSFLRQLSTPAYLLSNMLLYVLYLVCTRQILRASSVPGYVNSTCWDRINKVWCLQSKLSRQGSITEHWSQSVWPSLYFWTKDNTEQGIQAFMSKIQICPNVVCSLRSHQ